MPTTLTLHLTPDFLSELTGSSTGTPGTTTQNGVWAYLWNNAPPSDATPSPLLPGSTSNFTPLITAGQLTSNVTLGSDGNYDVQVALTDSADPTVNSGTVYLLVQSENPTGHHDLTTLIGGTEANIQPNIKNWNYGYAQFEFSLLGQPADQGDLTAIPGFARNVAVNISYANGATDSRGYQVTGDALTTTLTGFDSQAAVAYPTAPAGDKPFSSLDGKTSMVISPSNGNFGASVYPSSNWSSYLTAFAKLTDVSVSGATNGEPDASGIWHNSQYYSYTVKAVDLPANLTGWGPKGTYFEFSPNKDSQTQGYILISADTLQSNLYAAGQGTATLWQDKDLKEPYIIPGSGTPPGTAPTNNTFDPSVNNQWGNIFTPFFTGFTAGYWGATAQQSNPFNRSTTDNLGGGPIDLDSTLNQSPSYAFDLNRTNAVPAYQHNDSYSQEFFDQSNVYGSAFSDNLSNGLTPGPLISLASEPTSTTNVSNIDFYAYGSTETSPYFIPPAGADYLKLPSGQADYLAPTQPGSLQLIVSGLQAGTFIRADATVKLGIYKGGGQFDYATLASNGNLWQNYNVTGSPGSWSVTPGGTNIEGTFIINGLPAPATATAGQVYWYQLVVSDSSGDQKVFDFYATAASTAGQIQTGASSFAVDGLASIPAATVTPTSLQLNLNPTTSLPTGLLTFAYNSQFAPQPAAPVVGVGTGSAFTAVDNQNGTGLPTSLGGTVPGSAAPSVTLSQASDLAFGWTGTNNGTHAGTPTNPVVPSGAAYTPGLISVYSNKINAGDVAQINIVDVTTGKTLPTVLQATADLDGQWMTSKTTQLGNGTYTATMMEMLSDGKTPFGPASTPLTITVALDALPLDATSGGDGLQLDASGSTTAGNWIQLQMLQAAPSRDATTLLLYATNAAGELISRDGTRVGAGVTLEDATLATIGSIPDDRGVNLLKGAQAVYLPAGEQLHFAVLSGDHVIDDSPAVNITPQPDGSVRLNVGGFQLAAAADNTLGDSENLAGSQRTANEPWLYLTQGSTMDVQVAGSAANTNTLGFVRIDVDSATGGWSVGSVDYGATDAFYAAVRSNMDTGINLQRGGGFNETDSWTVAGASGYYAPVLLTPYGETFVIGNANPGGREQIRMFGENTFGIEDLAYNRGSDFDYNDMVVKVTPHS